MEMDQKLEYWKNRLLDLGKRNRLINCALPKDGKHVSRATLLICNPSYGDLWKMFSNGETSLEFPIPADTFEDDEQESLFKSNTFQNGVKTNQNPAETYKTLRSLMKKSKEFSDEKGLNALYIAFGFLNWKEKGVEGQEMRSPLLLVPVVLTQESLNDPIVLTRSDDEITINHALEQKLLNDFGIELPQFEEDDDWSGYLKHVQDMCASLNWNVDSDFAQLSLFSFLKINMYRDLEKNTNKIGEHHIVRALNGEAFKDGIDCSDIKCFNHDAVEPQNVFSVVDADSSQQDAILLAKRGVSFVLQGPPGTGKSQTITNIIAELMAEGKKVLFVSEKVAALQVVYKRLKQTGLGDFCLTLHNHNAKRREILNQLEVSFKLSRKKVQLQQDAFNKLYQLKETRAALNLYAQELHTIIEPLGQTIYQVNGFLAKYSNYKNIDYTQVDIDKFTPELFSQCESALEELVRIVDKSGYQQGNPWNGCVLSSITYEFRQQFLVDAEKLLTLVSNGIVLYNEITSLLGSAKLIPSYTATSDIIDLFNLAKKSPNISTEWLKLNLAEQIVQLENCVELLKKRNDFDGLHRKAVYYGEALQTSIQAVADATVNAEKETYKATNEAYNIACSGFISAFNGDVAKSISNRSDAFRKQFFFCQTLNDKYKSLQNENRTLKDALSVATQSLESEQQSLSQRQNAWNTSRSQISDDLDVKILLIDIEAILSRYRTVYRSELRLFNSKYRSDRKALLTYCKSTTKMSYSEALLLLDKVYNAQCTQKDLEKQAKVVNNALNLKTCKETEFAKNVVAIKNLSDSISINSDKVESMKQSLISEVTNHIQNLQAELSATCQSFDTACQALSLALGIEINDSCDFVTLKKELDWALHFQTKMKEYACSSSFAAKICECDDEVFCEISKYTLAVKSWADQFEPWLNKYTKLFEEELQPQFGVMPLTELKETVQKCKNNFASLEYLIDYHNAEKRLKDLGIDTFLEKAKALNLTSKEIIPIFKKCFYRSWLDAVIPGFPSVNSFRRLRQDEYVKQFRQLDKQHLEISKAALIARLISRLPDFDSFSANSGEVALLRREMAKQRKLMPTRKLIAAIPNLLPALKPCMMMSPLSVSTYLGNSGYEFDTVIFDEASQVPTEDAICSIFRAKQAIIAGDSKQLPPTDFFNSSISDSDEFEQNEDGEINDTGAYESLLDEASMLPTQTLLWHYRSKHEDLIAFSNAKIYQGNLITFPSPIEKADGMGVEYTYVAGGMYERGGKGNQKEAEKIADLVFDHFRKYPNRSLGIIAFGAIQQTAIEEAIIRKRRENPQYETFFKEDKEENVFIKNLETVQGDERDTIIFSIGYAPDASGKFIMNFGPLSRNGGERRLNVAITRARYNLKLVGSIMPTDIDVDRTSGQGPKLLRLYIDFAINGAKAILGETTINTGVWFDSSFEEAIYNFITAQGYDVVTQVGCSGYRIDMAVRHPEYNNRFAIGIECDGAAYHSARTARERDRLRQTVLEDMGWNIYRVWSTDWIKDQHTEGLHLLTAIKEAIQNYREPTPKAHTESSKVADYLDVSSKSTQESIKEKYKTIESKYAGCNANEIPISDFEQTMLRVLANNYGLDKEALFKETALYGYLWLRQGSTIKKNFECAYQRLLAQNKITEKDKGIKLLMDISNSNCDLQ
ncbi:DUF4011 domain-containing protein [Caproicibacterium sp. BJN0003]|uniref:DUF4011 domain-containing protein n=1 Tax=Caproicibacterium sp. BJN0003 TaxID=2994078 RepID=UPI0022577BF0|nr:DUF4011 domain-containing protein [Caproicibacterium sp. BJN0003]UZT82888.1 DUF4011 domain-containing protein [Caproicibacterium sp. BJN0003]